MSEEFFLQPCGPGGHGFQEDGVHAFARWPGMDLLGKAQRQQLTEAVGALGDATISFCEWHVGPGRDHRLLIIRNGESWHGERGVAQQICEVVQNTLGISLHLKIGTAP